MLTSQIATVGLRINHGHNIETDDKSRFGISFIFVNSFRFPLMNALIIQNKNFGICLKFPKSIRIVLAPESIEQTELIWSVSVVSQKSPFQPNLRAFEFNKLQSCDDLWIVFNNNFL